MYTDTFMNLTQQSYINDYKTGSAQTTKTLQCTCLSVPLSEAINGRSLIIEDTTIKTKYSAPKMYVKMDP